MSGLKWLIDQYFQLPRWERIGNIILLTIILISVGIVSFWPEKQITQAEITLMNKLEADLEKQKAETDFQQKNKYEQYSKKQFGNYNYNNAGSTYIADLSLANPNQLQKAGLSKKVAFNLFNYLKKGGKIKSEKDIRKIYGMTDEMANLFISNIRLNTDSTKSNSLTNKNNVIDYEKTLININTADSSTLVLIKGISPKMVPYIIKFRQNVGGFHSPEQLNEVFKSPLKNFDDIKPQVTVEGFKPMIEINSISAVELKKYKYFAKDNLATILVAYRDKHGKFTKPEDLKKCVVVNDEILTKITPYLVFE
jgi:competence protein ComEA